MDNGNESKIHIYPNPTTGKLEITGAKTAEIRIRDTFGRIVKEQLMSNQILDISTFPNGSYFISIKMKKGVFRKRIIKE